MKVSELEKVVLDYCETEKIPVINGKITPEYVHKVEMFIDVLKNTHKNRKSFEKQEPKSLGNILAGMNIKQLSEVK